MLKVFDYGIEGDRMRLKSFIEKRAEGPGPDVTERALKITEDVRIFKDSKLFEYTRKFDGVDLNSSNIRVTEEEIEKACANTAPELTETIRKAAENIRSFHEKQIRGTFLFNKGKGSELGWIIRPIDTVGIYVPGGTAPLPSSVLMNAIPAKIAGVRRIIMVTPPKRNGVDASILAAAKEAGVDEIYRIGGAQAIAALAYGTESVPKVDKITGPGNDYVTAAKRIVCGICGIDMTAGPSEICIVADRFSNRRFIAADMLSQAEHDPNAAAYVITTDRGSISVIEDNIREQLKKLSRKDTAASAIAKNGIAVCTADIEEALEVANSIAPEHLELVFENAEKYIGYVRNAGAVFIGEFSPEPAGDYIAGTNHVLPTCGTARFSSALSVDDFVKKISYIKYTREELYDEKDHIVRFAGCEGLDAHARSIAIRFGEQDD